MITSESIENIISGGEGYNAEFKVRVPKKVKELSEEVCAFANSAGGYLLIGVDDKNIIQGVYIDNSTRSAIQNSISEISPRIAVELYPVDVAEKTVWIVEVASGSNKPYVLSGAIYVREGPNTQKLTTAEEMRLFFQQSDRIYFDDIVYPDFDIMSTQFDMENFDDFRAEAQINRSIPLGQILSNLQVLDRDNKIKHGGLLFFTKHPEDYFFQAVIHCVFFQGKDKVHIIDDKTFGGPLYQQYIQTMAWLQTKISVAYDIEGPGPRREIWEIPLTVFKEAIINALSHRDYYEKGATIMLEVFDDRVEISNPGGLLPAVIHNFGTKSMTRNPLVFGLFTRMHLVERIGSGIPRMREEIRKAGLPEPLFQTEGFFTVIFIRPEKNMTRIIHSELSDIQKTIVSLLKNNSKITISDIAGISGVSRKTILKHIGILQKTGIIKREGSHRKGEWVILQG
jgi:ATP-dependent DNA helicase RecG